MADVQNTETLCGKCGRHLEEGTDVPIEERQPCPDCGSTSRKFRIELTSTVTATSTLTARLTNEPGQVIQVGTAYEKETAQPIEVVQGRDRVRLEDLPTEVIADSLCLVVNLLPPDPLDPDGVWVADVGVPEHQVPLGVGTLDDILLAAAEWFSGLADRHQQNRNT